MICRKNWVNFSFWLWCKFYNKHKKISFPHILKILTLEEYFTSIQFVKSFKIIKERVRFLNLDGVSHFISILKTWVNEKFHQFLGSSCEIVFEGLICSHHQKKKKITMHNFCKYQITFRAIAKLIVISRSLFLNPNLFDALDKRCAWFVFSQRDKSLWDRNKNIKFRCYFRTSVRFAITFEKYSGHVWTLRCHKKFWHLLMLIPLG